MAALTVPALTTVAVMTTGFAGLGLPPIATQLVGSWCKPQWLCDHNLVFGAEGTWWNIPPERRAEALDDAARLAIFDQERAGERLAALLAVGHDR